VTTIGSPEVNWVPAGDEVEEKPFGSRAYVTDRDADASADRDSDRTWYELGLSGVIMGWVNADDFAMIAHKVMAHPLHTQGASWADDRFGRTASRSPKAQLSVCTRIGRLPRRRLVGSS
jgi:hypothetical protein